MAAELLLHFARAAILQFEYQGIYYLLLFNWTANWILPVAVVLQDTIHKNTRITQSNTPRSNETQHTKLHKQ
jgi:hypothetical protein